MKYIQFKKTVLFSIIAFFPALLSAQTLNKGKVRDSLRQMDMLRDSSRVPVQTAYRKVDQRDLLEGVSFVDLPEINQKNYTTYSLDNMQAYVGGFNGNIWGTGGALVLVDGVPRDPTTVNPTAIKQISFLKGISAVVLYGSRAANGVIYISTKRGHDHPLQVNGRVNAGMYVPKEYPQYLGSSEYMSLYNEARQNDGLDKSYSQEEIYHSSTGNQPYRYPSTDFYSSDYLQDSYNRYDGTVQISGGSDIARYYTNINFNTAGSLLDFGEAKDNRNNNFDIRGNVDIDINDNLTANVGVTARYYDQQGVNVDYWDQASTVRPNRFTPLVPISKIEDSDQNSMKFVNNSNHVIDDKYLLGGTQLDPTNPFATVYAGGSGKYVNRQFQFNTGFNGNLENLLQGLTFHSMFAVDYQSSYNEAYNNGYATYAPVWNNYSGDNLISSLTQYGDDSKTGRQNVSNSAYEQTLAFSGQLNYKHDINDDQHISAMLIAAGFQQTQSGVYHRTANANLALQIKYNYQHKYYAEFSGAMPHSARLPKGNRNAISPTVTLGWRISEEGFMSDASAVDNLKLTASAGIVNTDLSIDNYYLYASNYVHNEEYYTWGDGRQRISTESRKGKNPDLTYAKRKEINVGLDASFFNKAITFKSNFFYKRVTGNVVQSQVLYPNYFFTYYPNSSFIPYANYNADQHVGVDFNMKFNKELGGVNWSLGLAGMYYDTKAVKRAENYKNDYQYRAGKPLDSIFGLESKGLFKDAQDVTNSPSQSFGEVQPGDIKYKDQNNDGVINSEDQVYLGKAGYYGSPLTFGVNLTAQWKDLTIFALGTGQFGAYAMKNSSYYWVSGEDKYSAVVRNRWTSQRAANNKKITYPRLTTNSGANNFRASDYWMYSTNRFDLAKVQVSYDLPQSLMGDLFLRRMRVYVSGSNLLTVSPNREVMVRNVGSAPQNRFYNLGIKAYF